MSVVTAVEIPSTCGAVTVRSASELGEERRSRCAGTRVSVSSPRAALHIVTGSGCRMPGGFDEKKHAQTDASNRPHRAVQKERHTIAPAASAPRPRLAFHVDGGRAGATLAAGCLEVLCMC